MTELLTQRLQGMHDCHTRLPFLTMFDLPISINLRVCDLKYKLTRAKSISKN